MKLKHYKPTGHNLIVEEYNETELKQGSIYLPQRESSMPMGKVLAVGSLCENIKVGDIVVVDRQALSNQFPLTFEDHHGVVASINLHFVVGVFSNIDE